MRRIIPLVLMANLAFSADINPLAPQNFRPLTEQEILNSNAGQNDLKIKEFYLNTDEKQLKELQDRDTELKYLFDEFDEALLNYKPINKPISTVERLQTHAYFTTTILLPSGSVISSVDISVEPITIKYEQNTILLRVKKDFKIANLTVIYSLKEKNYVANFIVEKYDRSKTDEKLNLVYNFENVSRRDDFEVMNLYVKTYGKYPKEEYSYIEIDGMTYRIIKDNKFGTVSVGNVKYRIDTGNQM
ncbi:hypothetical protein KDE13_09055 [Campylobacter sp. faydin G-140]|uniref:hypothetical protein n=1 Tax=Campylobacter anatolicus TaxID=2829105 RepID=UPI001B9B2BC8|nr:hypothetical protein [Campylobacter anatolicus]MBR8466481.1 hypothetical protein [Campylobacter anatolicus]